MVTTSEIIIIGMAILYSIAILIGISYLVYDFIIGK